MPKKVESQSFELFGQIYPAYMARFKDSTKEQLFAALYKAKKDASLERGRRSRKK